jgi:signal transduction histidine kinase/HAMP domain-containing protein
MRIVTKIWIGFALLIAGYVLTVSLTEINSRRIQHFLQVIEDSAIPCANAAQAAITAFKHENSLFQDAVVFGEASSVDRAQKIMTDLEMPLRLITADAEVHHLRRTSASQLEQQIRLYTADGVKLYTRLARNESAPDLPALAVALKARSDRLTADLDQLRDDLRLDLKTAMSERNHQIARDRLLKEAILAVALVAATSLITVVMLNLSSRLRMLIGASARLTSGNYDAAITDSGNDEVGQLAQGFEAMRAAIHSRNRELQTFNASLDGLVRERTRELEQRNGELSTQIAERQRAERSLRLVDSAIVQIDDGVIIVPADEQPTSPPEYLNPGLSKVLCLAPGHDFARGLASAFGSTPFPEQVRKAWDSARSGVHQTIEVALVRGDGSDGVIEWHVAPIRDPDGRVSSVVSILRDLTERKRLEVQHQQGQKMESIGQLAAGVAHEINTPIQFIGDNLRFLGDSFSDLATVLEVHAKLLEAARGGAPAAELIAATDAAAKRADVGYLAEEIPKALGQSLEGVTRVADIVRAMKEFSHPDQGEKKPTDLGKTITTTLTVARNEYKYVADLVTEFATDLPPVPCIAGEFNQVILNLVVNAAHAIGDVTAKQGGKGVITVSTRRDGDHAEVRIRDTGTGIPEAARAKIFDPFFTTKAVGKGTGQGLYIAHTVIVKKHGGTLAFETEIGKGTTFVIRLPLQAA